MTLNPRGDEQAAVLQQSCENESTGLTNCLPCHRYTMDHLMTLIMDTHMLKG